VPTLRTAPAGGNLCRQGGYVLLPAEGPRRATLIATGSELSIAVEARTKLQAEGIGAAVVSLPCWELFDRQPAAYRAEVLGGGVRIAIEAAGSFGWERYLGAAGSFIGMTGFGASAPAGDLYKHFGITAAAVVAAAKAQL
jgi:transketolase